MTDAVDIYASNLAMSTDELDMSALAPPMVTDEVERPDLRQYGTHACG